ncbi:hypothetical protein tinsulaeT_28650 [Thalassotalea insulae]|uniref:Winged helix-turn-helix domain-containing protein n=1 Tax=Thalassotalea insulae TaxID=2056778 RepID=A0ABQ6GYD5_9GAMM|nr:crosslink repair DNA glycosylase YcaQ family protein [Thalassotalea insulae]GLX79525.1 hypothetical protein tinsulaeT_28650 [Thalassotalea insulae]
MKTINIKHPKDLARLRRIALTAQGLLQTQPFGRGLAGTRKAINHLGYVQLDTVSVVERAHHHVLYARVPNFKPEMLDQLLISQDIFEYWAHAAAFLPIDEFRFTLPYKQAIKSGQTHWYKNQDRKLMNELLARIRSDGPLRSRDLESNTSNRAGWWDWKPAKKALEQLYMEGDLMVCDRQGFQKTYDLTERVLPPKVNTTMPEIEEFAEHVINKQIRCHGFATLKGLTYNESRNTKLRKAVNTLINEYLLAGKLEQIQLNNGEAFVIEAESFDRRMPRVANRMQILSPFDNSVIQRERLKTVFDYDYKIECYTPEAKRQYGYFCLPLLYRDQFIGRMDCKAHRKIKQLEIKSLHFEPHSYHQDNVISAFIAAIKPFMQFQQCNSVSLTKVQPQHLAQGINEALKTL